MRREARSGLERVYESESESLMAGQTEEGESLRAQTHIQAAARELCSFVALASSHRCSFLSLSAQTAGVRVEFSALIDATLLYRVS